MRRGRSGQGDAVGRAAEWAAAKMGSAQFLLGMTVFIVVWLGINAFHEFDDKLFVLNLLFSTMASYAAPLIMLAQNRTASRDQVALDHDRIANRQARADMEFLTSQIQHVGASLHDLPRRTDIDEDAAELVHHLRAALRRR